MKIERNVRQPGWRKKNGKRRTTRLKLYANQKPALKFQTNAAIIYSARRENRAVVRAKPYEI